MFFEVWFLVNYILSGRLYVLALGMFELDNYFMYLVSKEKVVCKRRCFEADGLESEQWWGFQAIL